MSTEKLNKLVEAEVAKVLPEVIKFRHKLHAAPELTWQEKHTSASIAKRLSAIDGMDVQTGVGKYGVVGLLKGDKEGPTIALRADMDALPLQEESDLPYKSQVPGVMHACGHDGHVAGLYGAALVLSALRSHIKGAVKFIFQPAEEGGAGAEAMINDGVLENPKVDVIYGLHGWTDGIKVGEIGVRTGALMACDTHFEIVITGRGCHAALPHLGSDQVLVGCKIVEGLQTISSRFVSPVEPIAVTVTKFQGGTAINIIPTKVELYGTLRALNLDTRDKCCSMIRDIARSIAEMHGASATVKIANGYPVTVNDRAAVKHLWKVAEPLIGKKKIVKTPPTMGAEDFSYYQQKIPGAFFFLGLNDGSKDFPGPHHPKFDFNDEAFKTGIPLLVHLVLQV